MGLFNRPTVATASTGSSETDQPRDIFSHSESYDSILAEQDRRRKEKLERQKVKREGKRTSDEGVAESPRKASGSALSPKKSEATPKRRRISGQDVGNLLKEAGLEGNDSAQRSDEEEIIMGQGSEERRSPRKGGVDARGSRTAAKSTRGKTVTPVIEVDDGSSDVEIQPGGTAAKQDPKDSFPMEEQDDESDEELAALARQARQRRRQQQQKTSASPATIGKDPSPQTTELRASHSGFQTPPLPDPPVKVLVVSRIENTNPLLVFRKLSQNLREIRLAYCKRQGFSEDFTEKVFLIHCMRRVYDVTTCRSLGLETDTEGNITMKGAEGKEGVDQVALEAVTDEIFAQIRAEKAREGAKRAGHWDPGAEAGAESEQLDAPPAEEEYLKLVLKAKDKADFKLMVKPVSNPLPTQGQEPC